MSAPCIGIGRLLGHRYRARYSDSTRTPEFLTEAVRLERPVTAKSIPMDTFRTYEGDVCERCGAVVNRRTPEDTDGA